MSLKEILDGIKLGSYLAAFEEDGIEADDLLDLDEEDVQRYIPKKIHQKWFYKWQKSKGGKRQTPKANNSKKLLLSMGKGAAPVEEKPEEKDPELDVMKINLESKEKELQALIKAEQFEKCGPVKAEINQLKKRIAGWAKRRHYFLSHKQNESKGLVQKMWELFGGNAPGGAWLDFENEEGQTEADMMEGIAECTYFVIILSPSYMKSFFCRKELIEAARLEKPAYMCFNNANMSQAQIGQILGEAKAHGIELVAWPSAFGISRDADICAVKVANLKKDKPKAMKLKLAKPVKIPANDDKKEDVKELRKKEAIEYDDKLGKKLVDAAENGKLSEVKALLENPRVDIHAKNSNGSTPLHFAAHNGHKAVALALVEKGADVKAKNNFDATALHIAAVKGHEAVALALVEKGADLEAKTKNGQTPLHKAALFGHQAVALALVKKGADVNAKDNDGETPGEVAKRKEHKELAKMLGA